MQPKVSIVMPCYNTQRFLSESLGSVLKQTLIDLELICVNDGSSDGTLDILMDYKKRDHRIQVIDKQNTGYGHSVNVGFDAANGEYLAILEPDDFMEPNMLEVLYDAAQSNDLDLVKCNVWNYRSSPKVQNDFYEDFTQDQCGIVFCPCDDTSVFFTQPAVWSGLYRTEFIRSQNIRFNETPGASYQDASFAFEVLLRAKRMMAIHDALIHYRVDNEASSVHDSRKMYCVCDEYKRMFDMLESLDDEALAKRMREVLVQRKFSTYLWNYKRLEPELGLQFLYKVQEEFRNHKDAGELNWAFPEKMRGQEQLLQSILDDPQFFHLTQHDDSDYSNALRTLRRYFKVGGIPYLFKLIRQKVARPFSG